MSCLLVVLIFDALVARSSAADASVGFVLDIGGTWTLDGSKLAGGDQLPAGGEIKPASADGKAFVVVCLFTGETQRYVSATTLPQPKSDGRIERVLRGIQGHYHGQLVHAISRGEDPADAVVQANAAGWDLKPVFGSLRAGKLTVRLTSVDKSGDTAAATRDVSIDWNPADPKPVAIEGLGPGLYRVQLLNSRSKEPTGYAATILVCAPEHYLEQEQGFQEVVRITQGWDAKTRQRKSGDFLRAYLEAAAGTP
ncbi:MAG TPA: hypothetical protein VG713_14795 [Pirellulales bacterium]|nr:hypothetical protein [Pirellulales bacterium]